MNFTQIKEAQNGWMTNHGVVPDNDSIDISRKLKKAIADGATVDPEFSIDELEAQRVEAIKAEAQRRIYVIAPDWKQANATARGLELSDKKHSGTLTLGEQAEEAAIRTMWDSIKAIRAASNDAELAGTALADIVWP